MAKKVLMICYYFPPLGMGGTQRAAKFAKYLPQFGWSPVVITVKDVVYYAQDATLLEDVKAVRILRTGSLDPLRLLVLWKHRKKRGGPNGQGTQPNSGLALTYSRLSGGWLSLLNKFISGWFLVPDAKVLWLPFILIKAFQIIHQEKPKVIFTTSPPHSSHLAGWLLRQLTGIKWVADFRDDWTGGESQPCPTSIHRLLNRFIEKVVLTTSDAVIGICEHLTLNLQKKSGLIRAPRGQKHNKFFTLTNGYDPEDFKGLNQVPREKRFIIAHCGSVSRVSDPEPFLAALASLLDEEDSFKKTIHVQFAGTDIFGRLAPLIQKYDLINFVDVSGYVPHSEALRLMVRAHLLLLVVVKKTQEEVMTGKVFEYLASGTPVLAIIPEGELAQLIRTTHRGTIVSHDNIEGIKKAIRNYYELFLQGKLRSEATEPLSQFDRKNLTRKLAELFELLARE